jgi:hypothetical protein
MAKVWVCEMMALLHEMVCEMMALLHETTEWPNEQKVVLQQY